MRAKLEALCAKWEAEAKPPKGYDWHDGQTIGRTGALRACAADLRALIAEPELVLMEVQPPKGAEFAESSGGTVLCWVEPVAHQCCRTGIALAPTPAHAPWYGESGGKTGWWWKLTTCAAEARKAAPAPADAGRKEE